MLEPHFIVVRTTFNFVGLLVCWFRSNIFVKNPQLNILFYKDQKKCVEKPKFNLLFYKNKQKNCVEKPQFNLLLTDLVQLGLFYKYLCHIHLLIHPLLKYLQNTITPKPVELGT